MSLGTIEGLLLDLDGVLYVGDRTVDGAAETIAWLRAHGTPFRAITNATRSPRREIREKLSRLGLGIEEGEIFTAPRAAAVHLQAQGSPRCFFVVADAIREEFAGLPETAVDPDYLVVGDVGDEVWSYDLLSRLFRLMMSGSRLLALHKGRYWETESGLTLDIGLFVAGLEYVTGQQAIVTGKPSRAFFELALGDMDVPASRAAIVGDDVESDIGGGQAIGLGGILVRTGKYRQELAARSQVRPDRTIGSIAELPALLA
jgi:HAD superfamily hydrolase (TIGR01458 family)